MNKNAWWAWAIKNSVCIICWTVLAIVFSKWWIAFFALLFISSLETKPVHYYYRTCDKCGKQSEYTESPEEALRKASLAGWSHYEESNKDYCPNCK